MNERIKELAVQVGAGTPESLYGRSDYIVMTEFELERFVELIVKECIEQGKQIQSQIIVNGSKDYVAGRDMGIEVFMNLINKRFGVENGL